MENENGEWVMENGEWRMENGEWRMENGERGNGEWGTGEWRMGNVEMENGEWRSKNEEWRMENGEREWRMENGEWGMENENGEWRMENGEMESGEMYVSIFSCLVGEMVFLCFVFLWYFPRKISVEHSSLAVKPVYTRADKFWPPAHQFFGKISQIFIEICKRKKKVRKKNTWDFFVHSAYSSTGILSIYHSVLNFTKKVVRF